MNKANQQEQDKRNRKDVMSTDTKEKIQQLENLLLSEDLEELNNATANFNIFNALKLQNNEIRHSNFLAWLLSPFETHKLGDYFLKEFLKSAIRDYSLNEKISVPLRDIVFYNLDDTEIKREYKNIDLLLISRQRKFVCIIENKIWTGEHDCQLEKYAGIVFSEFKDYKKLYIYLSPTNASNFQLMERKCNGTNDNVYYIPMNYVQVHDVIEKTLRFKSKVINSDVKIFIEHYNNMLERNIMGQTSEEIITLCRKIYRENKDAIDLIIENNNIKADIYDVLLEIISENANWVLQTSNSNWIRFIPKNDNLENLKFAKKDWVDADNILIIEINNAKNSVIMDIVVRQSEIGFEKQYQLLYEMAKDKFGYNKSPKKDTYMHVKSFPLISAIDYNNITLLGHDELKDFLKNKIYNSGILEDFSQFTKELNSKIN